MNKKIAIYLAMAALVFSGLMSPVSALAYQPIDQVNSNGINGYWIIDSHHWVAQTFNPTKNRLDALGVRVAGHGGDVDIRMELNDYNTSTNLIIMTQTIHSGDNWVYFDFSPDIEINTAHTYAIYLESTTGSSNAYWDVAETNTYSDGYAIVDNAAVMDQDFAFITYGYNYTAATPTPTPTASSTPEPSPTVSTTPAPSPSVSPTVTAKVPDKTAASVTVEPASGLVAKFADDSKSINLTWKKTSTTDITGYKILRSEKKDSDFTQLGTVKSDVLTYTDTTAKTDKTYYYIVRAYKDQVESLNSNVASATTSATLVATPATTSKDKDTKETNWPMIIALSVLGVIIIGIIVYVIIKRRKAKKQEVKIDPNIK